MSGVVPQGSAFSTRSSSSSMGKVPQDFFSIGGGVFVDPDAGSDDDDSSDDEVSGALDTNSIQSG